MWYVWSINAKSLSNAPPKQVLSPIARFSNLWNTSLVFDLCNILFFLAPKVSQVWYFWSTNTKSWSNAPQKQVLSPIDRFSNLWNTSLVFDLCNMIFFLATKVSQVWYFWSKTPKVGQMPHKNKF